MKLTHSLLAAGLSLALVTACSGNDGAGDLDTADSAAVAPAQSNAPADMTDDNAAMPGDQAGMNGMDGTAAAGAMSTDVILGMVAAVDKHEIAAAEQAKEKGVEGEVMEFANMLQEDHQANLDKTQALAESEGVQIATTGPVADMQQHGEQELQRLSSMDGEAYADAWVDAMVQGHTMALDTIDNQLLPAATDPEVQAHLNATRAAVAGHLDRAKELQGGAADANAAP